MNVTRVSCRPADARETFVKKGGTHLGVLTVPRFTVVTCDTDQGQMDLVVPLPDQDLVAWFFNKSSGGKRPPD